MTVSDFSTLSDLSSSRGMPTIQQILAVKVRAAGAKYQAVDGRLHVSHLRKVLRYLERGQFVGCSREVVCKVIQKRLQGVVEEVVPDSQCGFCKGRGMY